ncbi:MFS transporter [Phaeosphaeriaceae sp. PMI808]|nr:MFS transporter [Phaeosphaeriaceae sp. PMI808]
MSAPKDEEDARIHGDAAAATPEPPNGGILAWLCVLAGFLCQFSSFGFLNACGIFQEFYESDLLRQHSSSAITWIITIQIFLMFAMGPIIALFNDVFGPRLVVMVAAVVSLLGLFMLSLAKEYYQVMLAQGICYGIGAAGLFMPGLVATGQWFTTRRGLANGIVASGSSLGGVIFPIMVSRLIKSKGFPAAVRYTGLFIGLLLLIAVACMSAPFPPRGRKPREKNTQSPFKSVPWLLFTTGCFFIIWGLFAPFDYLPLAALSGGMSARLAPYTIVVANAASIPGRIIPGRVADKVGPMNTMMVVGILSGISILAFWLPVNSHYSNAAIFVFATVYGSLSGGFVSLMTPCIVTLCDGDTARLGPQLGSFLMIIALAALTGLPMQGALKDRYDDFQNLIIFAGTVMTVGGLVVASARVRKGGARWAKV